MTTIVADVVSFFFEHAGYSYEPKQESPEQGRLRCAEDLARAEQWLQKQAGHSVEWEVDEYADRSGIEHDGSLFACLVTLPCPTCGGLGKRQSLYGIDLGPDGSDEGGYRRVVEAELALELMNE
jgi:hypothetical protein